MAGPGKKKLSDEERERRLVEKIIAKETRPTTGRGGSQNFPAARLQALEQDDEKREFLAKTIQNNMVFFNKGIKERVTNDEELCERINWFFMTCSETKQLPTIEKLANAIGYHRATFTGWANGAEAGFSPITREIATQVKQILASIDAELASEGKTQPVVYMFRAKNFYEMRDQQDVVVTPNTGMPKANDVAAIEAKYAELPEETE